MRAISTVILGSTKYHEPPSKLVCGRRLCWEVLKPRAGPQSQFFSSPWHTLGTERTLSLGSCTLYSDKPD